MSNQNEKTDTFGSMGFGFIMGRTPISTPQPTEGQCRATSALHEEMFTRFRKERQADLKEHLLRKWKPERGGTRVTDEDRTAEAIAILNDAFGGPK